MIKTHLDDMELLSALDPGKQGLKPLLDHFQFRYFVLSALDPGKQGLKHSESRSELPDFTAFSA